jgi:hypothetical protein
VCQGMNNANDICRFFRDICGHIGVRSATTARQADRHSWSVAIATTYKADKFDNCTMSRSTGELEISFVRTQDGLLVVLDSPKWKLDRGNAYSVKLAAGSRSVDAKALAETKSVTIALADPRFNAKLRSANSLEVRGKGATLHVPLDGSRAALERLDECFEKNSREGSVITNPFVAPSQKP